MTVLPIVERELRVASRRRGTYWTRALYASLAVAVSAWAYLVFAHEPTPTMGKFLFGGLSGCFFFLSAVAGVRYTADCLSEEKREGTLGLLFLTDLTGHDVVLGKLAATSVSAIYGLLAIVPVLAIPLLIGGVAAGEFWRMVLVLVDTLFLSLAVGLGVSAVSRNARRAMVATVLLLAVILAGLPALGEWLAYAYKVRTLADWFRIPSAGSAYFFSFDGSYRMGGRTTFWLSVVATQALAWGCLLLASLGARATWHDRPGGAARVRWQARWRTWLSGGSAEQQAVRRRLLEANPCLWLGSRHPGKSAALWSLLAVVGFAWLVGLAKWPHDWLSTPTYIMTAVLVHSLLKVWLASEAGQRFGPDRRSGTLELVLSTPLSVRQIVRGHWLALRRLFLGPVSVVLGMDLVFTLLGIEGEAPHDRPYWFYVCLAGIGMFVADLYTLAWVGMWQGLATKHPNRATGATVGRVMVLPWVVWGTAVFVLENYDLWKHVGFTDDYAMLCLWVGVGLLIDAVFLAWSRLRLLRDLRAIGTQRYEPRPGLFARWRSRPAAGATGPAMRCAP